MSFKARSENIVVQSFENETLVYDLSINKAYLLNETVAFIWENLDGQTDTADLSRKLSEKTKQSVSEEFVWLAIDELKRDNLLEKADKVKSPIALMDRREVIKRAGLTTMIALPLVSSIVAPTAANAASACLTTGVYGFDAVTICGSPGNSACEVNYCTAQCCNGRNAVTFSTPTQPNFYCSCN